MPTQKATSGIVVIARLIWICVGPLVLLLLAYAMASDQRGWFAPQSIAFLVLLAVVVVCRRIDPLNSDGELSTPDDMRRYMVRTVLAGGITWALANLAGNHILVG